MPNIDDLENDRTANLMNLIELDDALLTDCTYLDLNKSESLHIGCNQFTVGHLNIHSIPGKYDDLLDLFDGLKTKHILPDILLLCETFLNEKNFDKFHFKDYDLISEYRRSKSKGGVSILIQNQFKYLVREDLRLFEEGKFESIFVEIPRKNSQNVIIGEIYRVPGTSEKEFLDKYEELLSKIRSENKKIIIGTDQNLDYLKINTHSNTMKFFELNLLNNLIPTITKPTRVTHSTATLIDNIYVDADLLHGVKSHIVTCDISDHFLCLSTIQDHSFHVSSERTHTYTTRKINQTVLYNIRGALSNTDWTILEDMSLNDGTRILSQKIPQALDFYAPLRNVIIPNKKKAGHREPWYTDCLKISSVKCLKMYRKVIHNKHDSPEYLEYKKYRNLYNNLRRKAKHCYYNNLINNQRQNSKKLWKTLNKITGKISNKKDIADEMIIDGVKETNAKVIANAFARYYSQVGKKLAEKIEGKGNIVDPVRQISQRVNGNCFLFPTTHQEIERLIKSLKPKDSRGNDNLSNNMLKIIYPSITNALWILFNKSLSAGKFPDDMKLAIVKPVYKAKSRTDISNYRPISLLTVISKILEKIVNLRLTKFLTKHNILYEGQYGFRKQRSTVDGNTRPDRKYIGRVQ
jgi:exonuclease III